MAFRDTIKDYRRVADYRLRDARKLLAPASRKKITDEEALHRRGAMYLAGYAVECLLKAYLIQQMNAQTLAAAVDRLNERRIGRGESPVGNIARSALGHRLGYLVVMTDLPSSSVGYDEKLWGRLFEWQSSWRYETGPVKRDVAEAFVEDVEAAVRYIAGKLL